MPQCHNLELLIRTQYPGGWMDDLSGNTGGARRGDSPDGELGGGILHAENGN